MVAGRARSQSPAASRLQVLGGLHQTRADLAWAVLLSLASGFLGTCTLMLSVFDIARFEAAARTGDGPRSEVGGRSEEEDSVL